MATTFTLTAATTGLRRAKAYFRDVLNDLNYKEWTDGFNIENIPANILDKAYHVEQNTLVQVSQNQTCLVVDMGITTRLFFKGFRDPRGKIDDVTGFAEAILLEALEPVNKFRDTIKNITLDSFEIIPLSGDNDNAMILEMEWTVGIILLP